MSSDRILTRVVRELGVADLVERLSERISPTDLQSLMLTIYRRRASGVDVAQLQRQFVENRFVKPAAADARKLVALEGLALRELPEVFDVIELSPVCPLGTTAVLTNVGQQRVVSTARNTEVVSDSTNVMALECARRRRELLRGGARHARVRLAASHRLLRAQAPPDARSWAHFRAVALCTAGRDEGDHRFEVEALREQLDFWLRFVVGTSELGLDLRDPVLLVRAFGGQPLLERVEEGAFAPLRARFSALRIAPDPQADRARGYYEGLAVRLLVRPSGGEQTELMDCGFTDWTRKLAGDRKERLLISGMGLERLAAP